MSNAKPELTASSTRSQWDQRKDGQDLGVEINRIRLLTRWRPRAPGRAWVALVAVDVGDVKTSSARAAAFPRRNLGSDHAPGDRLAASQFPEPGRGPDDRAEPAAADIPAIDADVDSGELIATQPPQVIGMHDPGHGSQVRPCSREPPRGNHHVGGGQDAHHDSMSTCSAR